MTYKLSNYLLIESFDENNDYTSIKVRLISLSNFKKAKVGAIVKDCEFLISKYDIVSDYANLITRLSDEEKMKQSDINEVVDLLKTLEIGVSDDSDRLIPKETTSS